MVLDYHLKPDTQGVSLLKFLCYMVLLTVVFSQCNHESSTSEDSQNVASNEIKFKKITASNGFEFTNTIDEEKLTNPFNYFNLYTGGGVAVGDINNDGLQDIFMASNMGSSKLFLNKGGLQFEDITNKAGCATTGWCTGATMADVNNDGWLDIYICRSYHDDPNLRTNLLFLNKGDGSFFNAAPQMKINDENYSIGASFFDYDLDGDLDLIVANHPRYRLVPLTVHYNHWRNPIKKFSSRLFKNEGGQFTEVTESAGILSYGFCLSLTTSDFNNDGWPDIFITVDHDEPDLVFANNGNGTFSNITNSALKTSSLSSMGIDAGDINNDQYPDLAVAEMLSEDHFREKVSMGMQSIDRFNYLTDTLGYKYYQMHNFLYLNNGNNTFSDIAQLANVHKSDWSWSCLFWDADNNGTQDISYTNGYYKDIFHRDKKNKLDSMMMSSNGDMNKMNSIAKAYAIQSKKYLTPNYLFTNKGNYTFENVAKKVGFGDENVSTGAAYADLDNDGDLDFIVNNVGQASSIYENQSAKKNYLRIALEGSKAINIIGSKISVKSEGKTQFRELLGTRGFQSSCELFAHFGLGAQASVEEVKVIWSDGKKSIINNPTINQVLKVSHTSAKKIPEVKSNTKELFVQNEGRELGIDFVQNENYYNDYKDQVLLPHKLSEYGPFIAKGDVNNDQLVDVYISAPHLQAGALYIQTPKGRFVKRKNEAFEEDKNFEDGQATFVDVDNDQDLDLVIGSTGNEFSLDNELYQSRLYLNNGKGDFKRARKNLPVLLQSSSCIIASDFDKDGDQDLFIGGRLEPKKYPNPGTSSLLINQGNGVYLNQIEKLAPELKKAGMVKDALWTDVNKDGLEDLVVVGEWMPVSFYIQDNGTFTNQTSDYLDQELKGWWNCIEEGDIDGDGLKDLVIGNLGYNYKYKATNEKPFIVYAKDFNTNGSCDIVLGSYYGDELYPVRGRSCSSEQLPGLAKKFPTFEEYALADMSSVYGKDLNDALEYKVNEFGSIILYKNNANKYEVQRLPKQAQIAPVNGVVIKDLNNDQRRDLIIAGNLYQSEIETGRADSGTGYVLINKGSRDFEVLSVEESGIYLPEDVKSLELIEGKEDIILVGINKGAIKALKLNP